MKWEIEDNQKVERHMRLQKKIKTLRKWEDIHK